MRKTILEIYALAVCFFAVACFVITLGLATWDLVEFSAPEFTIASHKYECHLSDEAYLDCHPEVYQDEKELTDKRIKSYDKIINSERRDAMQGLVQKLIILLIDILVFFIHWRVAKSAREAIS